MITDKNEAFRHNSCKKLAQLAKVIFQMSAIAKDRSDELTYLTIFYESTISQLVRQHHKVAEGISKDLVLFRKNCIDKACQDFGMAYKNVKSNYSMKCKLQFQKLQDIYDECRSALQAINDLKLKSLKESEIVLKHTNVVQNELSNQVKQHKGAINRQISSAVQPINEKISKQQSEIEKKLRQLRAQHAQEAKLKRLQINKIFQAELSPRTPIFIQFRKLLETLQNEVGILKEKFTEVNNSYSEIFEKIRFQRNQLYSNTRNIFRDKKQKMIEMQKNEKLSRAERAAKIAEKKQYLINLMKSHQMDINNLINQVNGQKHQRHQLLNSKSSEIDRQKSDFETQIQKLLKQHERNLAERQMRLTRTIEMIEEASQDMSSVKQHLKQMSSEIMESVKVRQMIFRKKLNEEILNMKKFNEIDSNSFRESARNRIRSMNQALANQDELNFEFQTQNRKNIHDLLSNLKNLQAKINKEMSDRSKKVAAEKEAVQTANIQKQKQMKEEIGKQINTKKSAKEKELKNLNEKLQKDLVSEKQQHEKENVKKLSEYVDSIQNLSNIENEGKMHQTDLNKIKSKLSVVSNNVKKSQQEGEKTISFLLNKIQNTEKEARVIQRRIEKETASITEEYEMKIQVEQVKLNNAIENLSKLYDKEENQRGADLIDMIRKVRDAKNRTNDLIMKTRKEINEENEEFLKKKDEITKEIEDYKSTKEVKELKGKLEATLRFSKSTITKLTNDFNTKITQFDDQIEKLKGAHLLRSQKIKQSITKADAEFQMKAAVIHSQKQDIAKQTSTALSQIQAEYDSKQKKLIENHEIGVLSMKKRIEAAKSQQTLALTTASTEIKTTQTNDADLISRKCSEDMKSLENVSRCFIEKDQKLADTITEQSKKAGNLCVQIGFSQIRKLEQMKIGSLKDAINVKDREIAELINEFCTKIEKMGRSPCFVAFASEESSSGSTASSAQFSQFSQALIKEPAPKEPSEPSSGRSSARKSCRSSRGSARGDIIDLPKKNIRSIRTPQIA